jgi:hypothetical protein
MPGQTVAIEEGLLGARNYSTFSRRTGQMRSPTLDDDDDGDDTIVTTTIVLHNIN